MGEESYSEGYSRGINVFQEAITQDRVKVSVSFRVLKGSFTDGNSSFFSIDSHCCVLHPCQIQWVDSECLTSSG